MEEREAVVRLRRGDISGLDVLVKLYYTRAVKSAYMVGDKGQAGYRRLNVTARASCESPPDRHSPDRPPVAGRYS
jgi:hypothetical protein